MEIGAILVFSSVILALLVLGSLRNHSGVNFELDASRGAIRGNRIRGTLVIISLAALSAGLHLEKGGSLQALTSIPGLVFLLAQMISGATFVLYRPKFDASVLEPSPRGRFAQPVRRLTRRSRRIWLGSFLSSVAASIATSLLAVL
ncbi:hypothetical protein ACTHAM_001032 [Cellulomonas soli]|uniref:hypothetical protein n=1 Tax=Cellulomonas soli TaxID=931535 RepID=UPI001D3823B2|nr:hypothetical protein [Cellulomonadaceae bacterium]